MRGYAGLCRAMRYVRCIELLVEEFEQLVRVVEREVQAYFIENIH